MSLSSTADSRPPDTRARDLARMRAFATGLLVAMLAVFVVTSLLLHRWPWLAYMRAFSEAATVGACADWFAVTALFRRPLGLPIPHTAVIPRNKDRIGRALGNFIADNFLTPEVLAARLHRLEVARWGGDWLSQPANAALLARRTAAALPTLLAALPPSAFAGLAGSAALAAARALPAGPTASRLLRAVWNEGRARGVIEAALDRLGDWLAAQEDAVVARVSEQSSKWMPKWIDRLLARKLSDGLQKTLAEMQAPDHPWRQDLQGWVEDFIHRLATDPALQAEAEALKRRVLDDPALSNRIGEFWIGFRGALGADLEAGADDMATRLEKAILGLGRWLSEDEAAQTILNAYSQRLAEGVIAPRRHEIGQFVGEVVAGWDAQNVVNKLELQVGRDLQYIRINGTLVGGLVGLALYVLTRLVGI